LIATGPALFDAPCSFLRGRRAIAQCQQTAPSAIDGPSITEPLLAGIEFA
jgi:hypothetical protein